MTKARSLLAFALALYMSVVAAHAAPVAFQNAVLADGPVLHYQLNEPSGTTVVNYGSLGATHDGTYNGTVTLGVPTASGDTGVGFDAEEDFIESLGVAPAGLTGNPAFSIETIFSVPVGATIANYGTFLHWGMGLTGKEVFFGFHYTSNDHVYAGFYNGGVRAVPVMEPGTWHHIVMVREAGGTANVGTTVYIDGSVVQTENDSLLCCGGTTPDVAATTFRISHARDLVRWITGTMDEVALYDRTLTSQEVTTHYELSGVSSTTTSTSSSTTSSTSTSSTSSTSTSSSTTSSTTSSSTSTSTTSTSSSTTTTTLVPAMFPPGKKLLVKQKKSGAQRLQLLAKGTEIAAAQPCDVAGELVIEAVGAGAPVRRIPLEAGAWTPIKSNKPEKGCKYRRGPVVATVLIKPGKTLKVVANADDLGIPLAADPRPVRIEVRHGDVRHCLEFGGPKGAFKAGKKLLAKLAAPASECPGGSPSGAFLDTL